MATKMPKSKQRVLQTLADFSTVILITAIFVIIYLNVTPFYRGFYCTDETIRFPYKADTVPLWAAGLYGVVVALTAVVIAELYLARPCCVEERKFSHRQNRFILNSIHGILLYALGAMSTMLVTEIGKHTIGRLRPHFLTVCDPDFEKLNCFNEINGVKVPIYVPLTEAVCRGADKRVIKEARLSFPSGHSSFTTYSMVFVIIYLEARLILQRTRFIKSIIQLVAFILAWHTCMSRVSDFKHHYTDVIAGALIGMSFAIFVTVVTGKKLWYVEIQRCKNKVPNSLDVSSADENEDYEDDDNLNHIRGNTFEL